MKSIASWKNAVPVGESEGEDEKIRLVVVRGGFVSCVGFTVGVNEVVGEILGSRKMVGEKEGKEEGRDVNGVFVS